MMKLMKIDLDKYKRAYSIHKEYETLYSPFTEES